jgi:hypothetical protein
MPYTMYMRVTTMSLWWPSCFGPAAQGAAWHVAALAASVWALFDPRLRLRLTCTRRARLLLFLHDQLPLRWCTPCALTRNALATRVSRFAYVAVVTALTTCMCVSIVMFWWRHSLCRRCRLLHRRCRLLHRRYCRCSICLL